MKGKLPLFIATIGRVTRQHKNDPMLLYRAYLKKTLSITCPHRLGNEKASWSRAYFLKEAEMYKRVFLHD